MSKKKIKKSIVAQGKGKVKNAKIEIINQIKSMENQKNNTDGSNIFSYIAAFLIVGIILLFAFQMLDISKSVLYIISILLIVPLLGALQLRNDEKLTEKSFLDLMLIILIRIPGLSIFFKKEN